MPIVAVNSADDVSVQATRQYLAEVRSRFAQHSPENIFWLSDALNGTNMPMGTFCTSYMLAQHDKRHAKTRKKDDDP